MTLRKIKDAMAGRRAAQSLAAQTPYHSEIGDDYLIALQEQVDALKPKGFTLTPLGEPGW